MPRVGRTYTTPCTYLQCSLQLLSTNGALTWTVIICNSKYYIGGLLLQIGISSGLGCSIPIHLTPISITSSRSIADCSGRVCNTVSRSSVVVSAVVPQVVMLLVPQGLKYLQSMTSQSLIEPSKIHQWYFPSRMNRP